MRLVSLQDFRDERTLGPAVTLFGLACRTQLDLVVASDLLRVVSKHIAEGQKELEPRVRLHQLNGVVLDRRDRNQHAELVRAQRVSLHLVAKREYSFQGGGEAIPPDDHADVQILPLKLHLESTTPRHARSARREEWQRDVSQ